MQGVPGGELRVDFAAQGQVQVEQLTSVQLAAVVPEQVREFALVRTEVVEDGRGRAVQGALRVHLVVELEFVIVASV